MGSKTLEMMTMTRMAQQEGILRGAKDIPMEHFTAAVCRKSKFGTSSSLRRRPMSFPKNLRGMTISATERRRSGRFNPFDQIGESDKTTGSIANRLFDSMNASMIRFLSYESVEKSFV
jgi:hypothetical protein